MMASSDFRSRIRRSALAVHLLLLGALLALPGCGSGASTPQKSDEEMGGAAHEAAMQRAAEADLQSNLAYARDKPPVIDLDEVVQRVGADSATRAKLARPVAALNAELVRLLELHRSRDATRATATQREIDDQAYPIHLDADRYENDIQGALTEEQHRRFHAYLAERLSAVRLPADVSHGTAGVGTAGNFGTIGHADGAHQDDSSAAGSSPIASDSTGAH